MNIKQELRSLSKKYEVRVRFRKLKHSSGQASLRTGHVIISSEFRRKRRLLLSILFHEIGHFYCLRNNKFPKYHQPLAANRSVTKEEAKGIVRTGLRAERFVDKWAAAELAKYDPKLEYEAGYHIEYHVNNFRKNFLSIFAEKSK